jgi:hypothetical protein
VSAQVSLALRQAARRLHNRWRSVISSVFALSLGMGLATATFAIIDGVLFKGSPVRSAHELVHVFRVRDAYGPSIEQPLTIDEVEALRESQMFQSVTAIGPGVLGLSEDQAGIRHHQVSLEFFETVGVYPALGRIFAPGDEGASQAVIGHNLWLRMFGGKASVLGARVDVGGRSFDVVGVMPPHFDFPDAANVWTNLQVPKNRRTFAFLRCVARIRTGVPVDTTYLTRVGLGWGRSGAPDLKLLPIEQIPAAGQLALILLFGVCFAAVALGWVQAAGAQLIASASSMPETAVQFWLGAPRCVVLLAFVLEAIAISSSAFVGALTLTPSILRSLLQALPTRLIAEQPVALDLRATGFLLLCCAFGVLLLAWAAGTVIGQSATPNSVRGLSAASRPTAAHKAIILAVQVAVVTMLTYLAAVAGRSMYAAASQDLGFDLPNLVSVTIPDDVIPRTEAGRLASVVEFTLAELQASPSIRSVSFANRVPYGLGGVLMSLGSADAHNGEEVVVKTLFSSANILQTLGVGSESEQTFAASALDGLRYVVLTRKAASLVRFDVSKVGATVLLGGIPHTVRAVVGDFNDESPVRAPQPIVFVLLPQADTQRVIIARAREGAHGAAVAALEQALVNHTGAAASRFSFRLGSELLSDATAPYRARLALLLILTVGCICLALLGLWSSVTFVLQSQRLSLAVRMSVGADSTQLVRDVLMPVAKWCLAAAVAGTGVGVGVATVASSFWFGVHPLDWVSVTFVIVSSVAVASVASMATAQRVTREDLVSALKS